MSRLLYRLAYATGFKPWEQDAENVWRELGPLLDREEQERDAPFGSALELGCGTGRWSVELARRGWQVTGIDLVPKAVADAQSRAMAAGVQARFVQGDVTALREAGVGAGFRFVLDVECFNHLDDDQRAAVGREVTAVTSPDASMLMLVWRRGRRGPLPPGASREDIEAALPAWRVVDDAPYDGELPKPLRGIRPRWYRLAR